MKGLILKDLYLLWKHLKSYIPLVLLFVVISVVDSSNMFFLFYPCMVCGMIPVNLVAFDERSKWDVYTSVLPFTRAQVVSAKYIMGLLMQGIVLLLVGIAQVVGMNLNGAMDWHTFFGILGTLLLLSAVATAVPLPFIFRYGVEKGRMGYYVMIGLAAAGSGAAAGFFGDEMSSISIPTMVFPVMVLAAAGVYALSWWISIRWYEAKDIG